MSDSDDALPEEVSNKKSKSKHLLKRKHNKLDSKPDLKSKETSKKRKKSKLSEASQVLCENESDDSSSKKSASESENISMDSTDEINDEAIPGNLDLEESHSSADEEQQEADQQTEFSALRKEMSDMPLEDLQKLKEMIGVKSFSMAMSAGKVSQERRMRKRIFKRENRNRPMEMSSKRPVKIIPDNVKKSKKLVRDPRFDDLSGEYDEHIFSKSYSFLGDIKQREKQKLEKKIKKESNPEKKKQLQYLVNRITQQEKTSQQKAAREEQERSRKQQERQLVKEGKTPFYLKQAEKKKLELAEKYRVLNKSGKVDNYLSKKRKKNAAKERKKLPLVAADMPT